MSGLGVAVAYVNDPVREDDDINWGTKFERPPGKVAHSAHSSPRLYDLQFSLVS